MPRQSTVNKSKPIKGDEFDYILPVLSSSAPKPEGDWCEVKRRSLERPKVQRPQRDEVAILFFSSHEKVVDLKLDFL